MKAVVADEQKKWPATLQVDYTNDQSDFIFRTLNVLEAVRRHNAGVPVVFASTNKVYGRLLADDAIVRSKRRHEPRGARFASVGI